MTTIRAASTNTSGNPYKVVPTDARSNGYQTSIWSHPFNGAFVWSASDVAVRKGEMQATDTRHADSSWTAGAFPSLKASQTITYGAVELGVLIEAAPGSQAAIPMWPLPNTWPHNGEIGILAAPKNQALHSSHREDKGGSSPMTTPAAAASSPTPEPPLPPCSSPEHQ
jgi:hypothetical protein